MAYCVPCGVQMHYAVGLLYASRAHPAEALELWAQLGRGEKKDADYNGAAK